MIEILDEANQEINPKLFELSGASADYMRARRGQRRDFRDQRRDQERGSMSRGGRGGGLSRGGGRGGARGGGGMGVGSGRGGNVGGIRDGGRVSRFDQGPPPTNPIYGSGGGNDQGARSQKPPAPQVNGLGSWGGAVNNNKPQPQSLMNGGGGAGAGASGWGGNSGPNISGGNMLNKPSTGASWGANAQQNGPTVPNQSGGGNWGHQQVCPHYFYK